MPFVPTTRIFVNNLLKCPKVKGSENMAEIWIRKETVLVTDGSKDLCCRNEMECVGGETVVLVSYAACSRYCLVVCLTRGIQSKAYN